MRSVWAVGEAGGHGPPAGDRGGMAARATGRGRRGRPGEHVPHYSFIAMGLRAEHEIWGRVVESVRHAPGPESPGRALVTPLHSHSRRAVRSDTRPGRRRPVPFARRFSRTRASATEGAP